MCGDDDDGGSDDGKQEEETTTIAEQDKSNSSVCQIHSLNGRVCGVSFGNKHFNRTGKQRENRRMRKFSCVFFFSLYSTQSTHGCTIPLYIRVHTCMANVCDGMAWNEL